MDRGDLGVLPMDRLRNSSRLAAEMGQTPATAISVEAGSWLWSVPLAVTTINSRPAVLLSTLV